MKIYRYSGRHSKIYIEVLPGSVYMSVSGKGRFNFIQAVSWNNQELKDDIHDALGVLRKSGRPPRRWLRSLQLHIEDEIIDNNG